MGHDCLSKLAQGTVCKILGHEEIKPHKVRYYLERRDVEFEQKMADVLCIYREVQILKKTAAKSNKPGKSVAIVSDHEKPGIGKGHRDDGAGFAARAGRPRDLRA